ncbi:unnamed protein product [Peniophora sp. CBMAI 1063]|nr:unnamed protein product [Peniophora sp. CBMAI 1063]
MGFSAQTRVPDADDDHTQAVEVRLGPAGAKAKYVRVELRKIETLPAPPPNSFYSIVGSENPAVLWQASEEWGVLQSQDIPFTIRIPEAIPLSLSLEKNAGIKYKLVGQVCIQGKACVPHFLHLNAMC